MWYSIVTSRPEGWILDILCCIRGVWRNYCVIYSHIIASVMNVIFGQCLTGRDGNGIVRCCGRHAFENKQNKAIAAIEKFIVEDNNSYPSLRISL